MRIGSLSHRRSFIIVTTLIILFCASVCNGMTATDGLHFGMKRTCSDTVSTFVVGLSLLWVSAPTPARAAFDDHLWVVHGTEPIRLDGGGTLVSIRGNGDMFAPKSPARQRAIESLQRQKRFQDERLFMCEDRGVFWENCFMYGVGGIVETPLHQRQRQPATKDDAINAAFPRADDDVTTRRRSPPTW